MLNICVNTSKVLDLNFNNKKCVALRIGKRFNKAVKSLLLDGQELFFVNEIKYLGVYIKGDVYFRCSYVQNKLKFYRCFNSIYSKCKSASSELICVNLFKSYCMPLVLYAMEAIDPLANELNALDKLISNAIGKIFDSYDSSLITILRDNLNLEPVHVIVSKRKLNFHMVYYKKVFSFVSTIHSINNHLIDFWQF